MNFLRVTDKHIEAKKVAAVGAPVSTEDSLSDRYYEFFHKELKPIEAFAVLMECMDVDVLVARFLSFDRDHQDIVLRVKLDTIISLKFDGYFIQGTGATDFLIALLRPEDYAKVIAIGQAHSRHAGVAVETFAKQYKFLRDLALDAMDDKRYSHVEKFVIAKYCERITSNFPYLINDLRQRVRETNDYSMLRSNNVELE